jgi:hypothetical protein
MQKQTRVAGTAARKLANDAMSSIYGAPSRTRTERSGER